MALAGWFLGAGGGIPECGGGGTFCTRDLRLWSLVAGAGKEIIVLPATEDRFGSGAISQCHLAPSEIADSNVKGQNRLFWHLSFLERDGLGLASAELRLP